jgi:hypothetical protein
MYTNWVTKNIFPGHNNAKKKKKKNCGLAAFCTDEMKPEHPHIFISRERLKF